MAHTVNELSVFLTRTSDSRRRFVLPMPCELQGFTSPPHSPYCAAVIRRSGCVVFAVLIWCICAAPDYSRSSEVPAQARVEAAFDADVERLVLQSIREAQTSLRVAMYALSRPALVQALADAAARGVRVQVKYDAAQADFPAMKDALRMLKRRRVTLTPIRMTAAYAAMHHKFLVVDQRVVLTGSANWTTAAVTVNHENMLRIESPLLAGVYARQFDAIRGR